MHRPIPDVPALAPDHTGTSAAPWTAITGVAAALVLVAWAGPAPRSNAADATPAVECRISHPPGTPRLTTVMLVNASRQTLPAGTIWAWAPAGGDPLSGERRVLNAPLASGAAVRVVSAVPAVALRCRAAVLGAQPARGGAALSAALRVAALDEGGWSPR